MHYVYVLQSESDNKFYTGYSADLKERLVSHNKGSVSSTKNRRPLKLVYYEACVTKEDAMKREKYLKTFHGKSYIKKRNK